MSVTVDERLDLELILNGELTCEDPHSGMTERACSVHVVARISDCTGDALLICSAAVLNFEDDLRAVPEFLCDACGRLASLCWTVRAI